jgi:hypothetical protein
VHEWVGDASVLGMYKMESVGGSCFEYVQNINCTCTVLGMLVVYKSSGLEFGSAVSVHCGERKSVRGMQCAMCNLMQMVLVPE